jgi:hypothetical protein
LRNSTFPVPNNLSFGRPSESQKDKGKRRSTLIPESVQLPKSKSTRTTATAKKAGSVSSVVPESQVGSTSSAASGRREIAQRTESRVSANVEIQRVRNVASQRQVEEPRLRTLFIARKQIRLRPARAFRTCKPVRKQTLHRIPRCSKTR